MGFSDFECTTPSEDFFVRGPSKKDVCQNGKNGETKFPKILAADLVCN